MTQVGALGCFRLTVGFTESFRLGPCFKSLFGLPNCMGRVECVIVKFAAFEQRKGLKALYRMQIRITLPPRPLQIQLQILWLF